MKRWVDLIKSLSPLVHRDAEALCRPSSSASPEAASTHTYHPQPLTPHGLDSRYFFVLLGAVPTVKLYSMRSASNPSCKSQLNSSVCITFRSEKCDLCYKFYRPKDLYWKHIDRVIELYRNIVSIFPRGCPRTGHQQP